MMRHLNLSAPDHITEALRTNMSGGETVMQLLAESGSLVPFMAFGELNARLGAGTLDLAVLDVREKAAYDGAHIPGARNVGSGSS